jgi:hypothetical protein
MIPFSLFLAPGVIAQRLPRLWWEAIGGNPFGPRETDVMVSEKMDATQKGAIAAQRAMMSSAMDSTLAALRGNPMEAALIMLLAPSRITEAALQPAAVSVRKNMRRLARD